MKTAIIVSKKDPAGMNIKECLARYDLKQHDAEIFTVEKESIFNENIDKIIEAELFIFATKHQSKEERKNLCVHVPGNWGKAEFGGADRKLCIAPASLLKKAFIELNKWAESTDYEVTLECVHHGPFINKPVMFIEIGTTLKQWQDKKAAELIAKTIFNVLNKKIGRYKIAVGIGGPHYCDTFNRILLRIDIALGQICPKYQLQNLDREMIMQAIEKNLEKVDFIILDWKGLGKEKQRIVDLLDELNLEYKRTDKLL